MNESNSITAQTALFGFIAESAQSDRFSVELNRRFKERAKDAMMIPMNIREDDIYFTLSNMRRSHLKGAYIAPEYRKMLLELLEEHDEGFYDFVWIREGKLIGARILPAAIGAYVEGLGFKRIAIIGSNALASALAEIFKALHVSFFDPEIESLMQLSKALGKEIDINRIAPGMQVDLSAYDMLIDTTQIGDFSMITALPSYVMQLENEKGTLRSEHRIDYAAFLPHLSEKTYKELLQ